MVFGFLSPRLSHVDQACFTNVSGAGATGKFDSVGIAICVFVFREPLLSTMKRPQCRVSTAGDRIEISQSHRQAIGNAWVQELRFLCGG